MKGFGFKSGGGGGDGSKTWNIGTGLLGNLSLSGKGGSGSTKGGSSRSGSGDAGGAADGMQRSESMPAGGEGAVDRLLIRLESQVRVRSDYKVEIDADSFPPDLKEEFSRVLSKKRGASKDADDTKSKLGGAYSDASWPAPQMPSVIPKLTICIMIVGTRGDVQPFISIGKRLQEFGHRVRLASHATYREFVTKEGLEFYPLGGDPKVLAEYMVKNKGFLTTNPKEVATQRVQLKAIIESCWPAVTEPDTESGGKPFRADAIIANPPTIAHTTVAEALGVPIHVFFTMPWTPTNQYPHPLAYVSRQITGYENILSYAVVENLMWIGMKDMINSLRKRLGIPYMGFGQYPRLAVPYGYIWSPTLVPKASDWNNLIDVVGFCFLDLASSYTPPQDLVDFLSAGEQPIFIGFGSLPVEDPAGMTMMIVDALSNTGQRGIIQKGWGGLGDMDGMPSSVYVIGNCPHDWLFTKCKAVVHHGGAGTTAAGLKVGCPTTIVPFFGDQGFWGSRVAAEGVGPEPIPIKQLTLDRLIGAINFMLMTEVKNAARIMARKINSENGVEGAVQAFHKHLPPGFTAGDRATPWLDWGNGKNAAGEDGVQA